MIIALCFGVVITIASFWGGATLLISRGGWARLAKEFATPAVPAGKRRGYVSAHFRPLTSYKNSVAVTLTAEGIHLAMMPLFRVGHPPLLIPWQYVERCSEQSLFSLSKLRIELNAAGVELDIMLPTAIKAEVDACLAKRGL